ncbi:phosphoribosylaminoimidazolesuccinocarboxamide synthase [Candidiatus Paracoxiella cheracis]|uniref:phosphoribosylaminoimidazolesuccinocarboxamide synthase n=1 Tax=Candidiatus Paracoxiella cheracis TaxID=3405120 RepID=UPI003BF5F228
MVALSKKELLYSGKVKSLFKTEDPNYLIAEFRDDTTAFDGAKHEKLAHKGMVNNQISAYIMQALEEAGVPTHFEKLLSPNEVLLKHLKMIPVECVIRNVAAGSLCRRLGVEEGLRLDPPLYELFLKNDELHDPMISENHAISFGWATADQLARMKELTFKINDVLSRLLAQSNMLLVDSKYEFGVKDGEIYLGDEISPDSCRIWDMSTHEIMDKDRFRKDLGGVIAAYEEIARRLGIELPA